MVSSIQRLLKVRNFTFWVNTDTLIGKQSNQDWINPIHLKNNVPDKKDTLIVWFLIMTFTLWFYHQLRVKWVCIHIGNSSEHIGPTHSQFQKCLWMFDSEWNAYQIGILDNFFNEPPPPPEVKKGPVSSTFNNFVYLNRNFHLSEISG